MTRKILSWLALALCEGLMIAAFIIFRGDTPTNVLVLNITVCTIILGVISPDFFIPWDDKHTANLGCMGVRWTVTTIYSIAAIAVMFLLHEHPFKLQLLVQGGLLVALLIGIVAMLRTREQISNVYEAEREKVAERDDVKRAWRDLLEKMDMQPEFPSDVRERTNKLVQELRYLSPTNNPEAIETDQNLVEGAQSIGRMIFDYRLNSDQIAQRLSQCERLLQRRRTQYSK